MEINSMSPRTATITLLDGEAEAKIEALRDAAERLKPPPSKPGETRSRTTGQDEDYVKARDAYNEAIASAEERGVKVILRAVGRKKWREMVAEHPPRPNNDGDEGSGVNTQTFGDALVPASIASPVFESDSHREIFLDSLNDAQFEHLFLTAFALNRTVANPKARMQ